MSIADSKPRQSRKAPAAPPRRAVPAASAPALARYDEDFARWAFEQARIVREWNVSGIDVERIAEELETLGRHEFNKLESALVIILMHMLKWDCQPQRRSRSWVNTILIQRLHVDRQIEENPSLQPRRHAAIAAAYKRARVRASVETKLSQDAFPLECPYRWQEITQRSFAYDPDGKSA